MSRSGRCACVFALLPSLTVSLLSLAAPAQDSAPSSAEIQWEESFYNPVPIDDDDDVILPLPCGGAMAFRWIRTPVDNSWMDDVQVQLGSVDVGASFEEYARVEPIVGSLSEDGSPARRGFLMGKYEVTRDQYAAVMADGPEDCPSPSMGGRLPIDRVSWFDAIGFASRLTEWLLAEAPDALPMVGQNRSFIRLPTEVEWEYAVRGGTAVSDVDFVAPLFPMPDGIGAYAWSQGPSSCDGPSRPVGMREPNPLGLHDMLGNAEEMTLDPFRASRSGRLHGQIGGMVTRGGSCLTPASRLRSSLRTEYSYYSSATGQALRLESLGFRVMVSAPVVASDQRLADIETDWIELFETRNERLTGDDPLQTLERLVDVEENMQNRAILGRVYTELSNEIADRNDLENDALQSTIMAAAALIRNYRQLHQVVWNDEMRLPVIEALQRPNTEAQVAQIRARLSENAGHRDATGEIYLTILRDAAVVHQPSDIEAQADVVIGRFAEIESDSFLAFVDCFAAQARHFHEEPADNFRLYLGELVAETAPNSACILEPVAQP